MTVGVGDAAYSNCGYIEPIYHKDNLISITRDRKNRAAYNIFSGDQKKVGRKRYYGEKVDLLDQKTQLTTHSITEFDNVSKKGNIYDPFRELYVYYKCFYLYEQ